jgi:peptide/nickel transport system substrate-binding protein
MTKEIGGRMKKKIIWLGLSFLLVMAMVLASCTTKTSSTTTTQTTTTPKTTATTTKTTTTTTNPVTTTATTTAATGNWWDSLGTPQYGGTITIRDDADITNWDPWSSPGSDAVTDLFLDNLTGDDWTENPTTYAYQVDWRPPQYVTGRMAQTYEFTSPSTWVVHLRHGMHWQNLPPVNGREVVGSDIVANYVRLFGLGQGTGSPYYSWYTQWNQLQSLTVSPTDAYTVIFQWKTANSEFINELVNSADGSNQITCPEAVKTFGNNYDWHGAIGCGPFMVTDFVSGSSATLDRNPNYYGMDERHPQNQLPYADKVSVLIMPDNNTALAAMRSGKIDIMYGMSNTDATNMKKTNPDITQIPVQGTNTLTIEARNDKAPFNNLQVREALQEAIDLPTIAQTYYSGNCSPYPSTISSMYLTGWGLGLYPTWPSELKATYDFNQAGAKALLSAAGLSTIHTDCVAVSTNLWDMNLLQIVQGEFAQIGVTMDIRQMDVGAWTSFVRQNHNEDALSFGHSSYGASYEPIFAIGIFTTNNSGNISMVADPQVDAIYARAVNATNGTDFKQAIYDMNYRVALQHFSIVLTTPNTTAFCQPWLKGYNGQAFAADFVVGAPLYGGFYLSRFWVDSSLKK